MACKQCGGDYVIGEGGKLECNRCGYIGGDISLLFRNRPSDGLSSPAPAVETASEERPRLA